MISQTAATSEQLGARFEAFWQRFPYRQVPVDGVEWHYVDTGGDAPPILMLPGGSYRPDNYFQLIDALADDFRIISPAYPPVYPLRRVLDGVAGVLDDAGLDAVTVFGCSYGGYVAQAMAQAMPERVRELVLAQTGTRHFAGPGTMRVFLPLFAAMPLSMIRAFTWRLWTRWFTAPAQSEAFWRARLRTELMEMSRPQHVAGVRNIVDFMATCTPAPGWLQPWHGRVLILEATQDQAFSAEQREELRLAYPEATVRPLTAGHTALFTAPDQFTAEIRRFFEEDGGHP
ncbi:alpha/beta fold hydrolase [Actinomycetospora chibensis]|uniref:Maspardin n=1 Tax=Actinomycetospora chibensis TaxID=663606 RepID=A0ABV9RJU9_9PSEU|nr:alpha/beta hydrolase [Actinomycetospora chibensis]MDD7924631.1 alpha/beta hydrolase [Actinomycetospora chibensis]